MTREKFIKKWLGNNDYQYTEQNRDLMRDDLDEVINRALRQQPGISSVCVSCDEWKEEVCDVCGDGSGWYGDEDITYNCSKCNPNGI